MVKNDRAESWLVSALTEPEPYPCLTSDEAEPVMTWQLLQAAQQTEAVISYFARQLMGDDSVSAVNTDECADEFKVLASQFKHFSVTGEDSSKLPKGLLFYKKARIVAPPSICQKLMRDTLV